MMAVDKLTSEPSGEGTVIVDGDDDNDEDGGGGGHVVHFVGFFEFSE